MDTQIISIVALLVVYVVALVTFSQYWKKTEVANTSYTANGDMFMVARDNVTFDRELTRDTSKQEFKNDAEKCEWALEKMKDIFQFYAVADNTMWPYQIALSVIGACIVTLFLGRDLFTTKNVVGLSLIVFMILDLPRRFVSFHKSSLIVNKALNLHTFYYKHMRGKNCTTDKVYLA